MEDHIKIIAILWIVFGSLSLIGSLILFMILFGASLIPEIGPIAPGILRIIGIGLSGFLAVLGAPKIIGGIGLLKKQEWGRILVLVVSFLSLINVPFGTALGVYSIVVLFDKRTAALFQSAPRA
jgi:hypothetical protein